MLNKLKYEVFGEKRDYEVVTEPGDKMRQTWRSKIDVDGVKKLVEDEYYDQDEEIQSYEESVNINNIIARYVAGDDSALDRAKAFYADVSKVPKNMAQILEMNNKAQQVFMSLDPEIRNLYQDSYWNFLNNPEILDEYLSKNSMEYVSEKDKVVEDAKEPVD